MRRLIDRWKLWPWWRRCYTCRIKKKREDMILTDWICLVDDECGTRWYCKTGCLPTSVRR